MALNIRRIFSVLAVTALMVATMVASAVPAFADKGGGGHTKPINNGGDCETTACQLVSTDTGKSPEGQGGGRETRIYTVYYGSDSPVDKVDQSSQGGGKGTGGGNCTSSYDYITGEFSSDGNGKRCG